MPNFLDTLKMGGVTVVNPDGTIPASVISGLSGSNIYAVSIGDGSTTTFTVTHNLGSRDVVVVVRQTASPYAMIQPDIIFTTINTISVVFSTAPTTDEFRVTVVGAVDVISAGVDGLSIYPITPPDLADFTWINQSTATAVQVNDTIALHAVGASGESLRILKQAIPDAPYKVRAAFLASYLPNTTYIQFGLCVRESSSGKLVAIRISDSGDGAVYVTKYSGETASVANYTLFNSSTSMPLTNISRFPFWFEIADDGVYRTYSISNDGEYFYPILSGVSNTDYCTPDQIGFFGSGYNSVHMDLVLASFEVILGSGAHVPTARGTSQVPNAAYIVGERAKGLSNQVVIPKLLTSPDALPASPRSFDDEFDAGTLDGKWSWVNQSTATATLSHSHLTLTTPYSSGAGIRAIVQSISAPFVVVAHISVLHKMDSYPYVGLVLRESGTGKLVTFQITSDNGSPTIQVQKWSDATTYVATVFSQKSPTGFAAYLRITDNNTNYIFEASHNGVSWYIIGTVSRTAYMSGAANQIGLMANVNSGSGDVVLSCDFIRSI